ncbi:protein SPIRAL1-like 1 [Fagus crenata]
MTEDCQKCLLPRQSSLGYLFGSGEAPAPAKSNAEAAPKEVQAVNNVPASKPAPAASEPDRPSTKVHSAPGGGSSLGYLFGGGPAGGGGN